MKAYPLIYARTKNVDFVPDFLTRPSDLDCQMALKYVGDAMKSLDTLHAIRYSTFSVGDYCICGGISCITKVLVEQLKQSGHFVSDSVNEYLSDCKGRSIASFIGFAIPKSEVRSGKIPDVKLQEYWQHYLEYLKHQWENAVTSSEKLDFPPIKLKEKTYSSFHKPMLELVKGKYIAKNYAEKPQETLDYFFDQILNKGADVSFISDIIYKSDWDVLNFNHVAVSEDLYRSLTSVSYPSAMEEKEDVGNIMSRYKRSYSASSSGNGIGNVMRTDWKNQKKTSSHVENNNANSKLPVAAIIVGVAVIILIVVLLMKKN